jgi:MFS family permease
VTYVPYICAELPSNLVIKRVGPRLMLPGMCFCWGIVATLQSQVQSYSGLLACRAVLGLCEGGLFPGIVLYLSGFYKPHELQVRVGLFFSAAALSGAFSGLLAAAIQQMESIAGLHGWQWIFLLEGLFTVLFATLAFYILPNTPHQVRHFTPEQADWCVSRLRSASIPESHKISLKAVCSTFKDIHIWMMCTILFCNGVSLFGLAYFTPSIVASLEYSQTHTQLLTVPPFACAFVVTMISAFIADRYKRRGLTAICTTCLALVGFSIFLTTHSKGAKYTALCFLITGTYSAAPSLISWIPNNVATHSRRATAVAMGFIATNVGGIVSTWIYPKSSAPSYKLAARFNLSLVCISLALMALLVALLRYKNQKKAAGHRDGLLQGLSDMSAEEQHEILGDHHPSFKYTL